MSRIKMSLIDNDYVLQAKTDINVDTSQNRELTGFFNRLKEELLIGETEFLTIEGLQKEPINFRISVTD